MLLWPGTYHGTLLGRKSLNPPENLTILILTGREDTPGMESHLHLSTSKREYILRHTFYVPVCGIQDQERNHDTLLERKSLQPQKNLTIFILTWRDDTPGMESHLHIPTSKIGEIPRHSLYVKFRGIRTVPKAAISVHWCSPRMHWERLILFKIWWSDEDRFCTGYAVVEEWSFRSAYYAWMG